MVVVRPAEPSEEEKEPLTIAAHPGPCYLRRGRAGEPAVHHPTVSFQLGKAIMVRDGFDLTIISTGALLETAVRVAEDLERSGVEARVLSMHTVKPLDVKAVLAAARETSAIVTLEEHSVVGGLGGAVAEVLAESNETRVPFKRIGIPSTFSSQVGDQEYQRSIYGLSKDGILKKLEQMFSLISR